MKPSERLQEIYRAELAELCEDDRERIEEHLPSKAVLMNRVLGLYLDEQSVLEQRRRAVTRAIALSRHPNQFYRVAEDLTRAGLVVPEPDLWHRWTDAIIQAAEREGLL